MKQHTKNLIRRIIHSVRKSIVDPMAIRRHYAPQLLSRQRRTPPRTCLVLGDASSFTGSVLARILKNLDIRVTTDPAANCDVAIKWAPWSRYQIDPVTRAAVRIPRIINDTHFNCKKSHLDACHLRVFGYSQALDPTHHNGLCVAKSETNAAHDGRILQGPIDSPERGVIYQQLIDNRIDLHYVEDLRIPIFGSRIPFVYLKYRPLRSRFSNANAFAAIGCAHELFSSSEVAQIIRLAQEMGLEYGELDVLRDRVTDLIHVIDANNTPYGPPNSLPPDEARFAVALLAQAFDEVFLH
jgi:hypothetical protein